MSHVSFNSILLIRKLRFIQAKPVSQVFTKTFTSAKLGVVLPMSSSMRNEEKSKPCCKEQGRKQELQSWEPRKKGNSSRRTLLLLKGSDGSQSRESKKPSRKWQLGLRKPNGAVRSLTAWQQKMGSSELHRSQKLKRPRSLWERKQVKVSSACFEKFDTMLWGTRRKDWQEKRWREWCRLNTDSVELEPLQQQQTKQTLTQTSTKH